MSPEQAKRYFQRIGLTLPEQREPDGALLCTVHYAHVLTVPYENLCVFCGEERPQREEDSLRRVVDEGKGGACVDLCGAFAALLRFLGFREVQSHAAVNYRDHWEDSVFRHRLLTCVDSEGQRWYADVGDNGPTPRLPLPLRPGEYEQCGDRFKLVCEGLRWTLFDRYHGEWRPVFSFEDVPVEDEYFYSRPDIPEGDPARELRDMEVFALKTPAGRRTLVGPLYRESDGEVMVKKECVTDEEKAWAYAQFRLDYEKAKAERALYLSESDNSGLRG